MDLLDYASKIIKQEVKLSSVVCPYEGFKSMGVKACEASEKLERATAQQLELRYPPTSSLYCLRE